MPVLFIILGIGLIAFHVHQLATKDTDRGWNGFMLAMWIDGVLRHLVKLAGA